MSDDDGGLQVLGKIALSLGGMHSIMQKREAQWIQRASDVDKNHPTRAQAICPSPTANFSMLLGTPSMGRVRSLRRLVVGGTNITTSAAGTAYVIVSPTDPITTSVDITSMVDKTNNAFPQVAFYGTSEILLRNPDRLWVVINGGTANQQYTAAAFWQSYQDGAYAAEIDL